jgi:thiol-disulfide isomerase/thioredoxin
MKKITLILFLFGFLANAQVNNYNVGDVVDDFTVTDVHGVEHNLYTITASGKYVYLDFFFDTCVPCQQTTPIFNEFYDKYGCNSGDLYMISINDGSDTDAEVIAFENLYGGPFNHAPAVSAEGGSAAVDNNFGINAYPTYCLIGPDNTLVERDIWPLTGVETFEATFPTGFEPQVMECTLGLADATTFDFNIYPTVSKGNITINLPSSIESSIAIFDSLGQQVFQNNYSDKNINLNLHIAQGVYIVKVTAENNSVTKRIIIK